MCRVHLYRRSATVTALCARLNNAFMAKDGGAKSSSERTDKSLKGPIRGGRREVGII